MSEVGDALLGGEVLHGLGDRFAELFDGASGRLAEEGLELGEGELNWVEVRAVGRQVLEAGPGRK